MQGRPVIALNGQRTIVDARIKGRPTNATGKVPSVASAPAASLNSRVTLSEPGREVRMLEWQAVEVTHGPGSRASIQWTLRVVGLKADHLADTDHELRERLAGAPVIADADPLRIDVGMEDGRRHSAEW